MADNNKNDIQDHSMSCILVLSDRRHMHCRHARQNTDSEGLRSEYSEGGNKKKNCHFCVKIAR